MRFAQLATIQQNGTYELTGSLTDAVADAAKRLEDHRATQASRINRHPRRT